MLELSWELLVSKIALDCVYPRIGDDIQKCDLTRLFLA